MTPHTHVPMTIMFVNSHMYVSRIANDKINYSTNEFQLHYQEANHNRVGGVSRNLCVRVCVCERVCVCVHARTRVCVCVCVCAYA